MAIALEISIQTMAPNDWTPVVAASMQAIVDVSGSDILSGSFVGSANLQSIVDLSDNLTNTFTSGSQAGIANSYGINDQTSQLLMTYTSGSNQGVANSYGVATVPEDERNNSVQTSDNPSSTQGTSDVDWNPFPEETIDEDVSSYKERDLTRFQKTYSFERRHPVRIRIFRR